MTAKKFSILNFGPFFGLFTASFAIADYGRETPAKRPVVATQETEEQRESLRRCLQKLHGNARDVTSYKLVSDNRNMCDELYYIHHCVEEKVGKLKQQAHEDDDETPEEDVCDELYYIHHRVQGKVDKLKALESEDDHEKQAVMYEMNKFTRKLCRSAMIRNSFFMDWLLATCYDNGVKCFVFGWFGTVWGVAILAKLVA